MEEQHVHGARTVESGCLGGKLLRMANVAGVGDRGGGGEEERGGSRRRREEAKEAHPKRAEVGRGKTDDRKECRQGEREIKRRACEADACAERCLRVCMRKQEFLSAGGAQVAWQTQCLPCLAEGALGRRQYPSGVGDGQMFRVM